MKTFLLKLSDEQSAILVQLAKHTRLESKTQVVLEALRDYAKKHGSNEIRGGAERAFSPSAELGRRFSGRSSS